MTWTSKKCRGGRMKSTGKFWAIFSLAFKYILIMCKNKIRCILACGKVNDY
jgi:hypothetical protein